MILLQISLNNFGPFNGEHKVRLFCQDVESKHKPVRIIGGLNGSGKSSILEAVRLCLHGRQSLDNPTAADYQRHIYERFHCHVDGQRADNAHVELEILIVENGLESTYRITRRWSNKTKQTISEDLTITQNGQELVELYSEQYQSFLNELVPLGLAEFFFFDGERIQKLAEDEGADAVVADSIRSLLGLNTASKLQNDLAIFMRAKSGSISDGDLEFELSRNREELQKIEGELEDIEADRLTLGERLQRLVREADLQERKISSEGGDYANKRDYLLNQRDILQAEIESKERELHDLANGLLPFCLAPESIDRLRCRLLKELEQKEAGTAAAALNNKRTELLDLMGSSAFWDEQIDESLSSASIEQLRQAIADAIEAVIPKSDEEPINTAIVQDLSSKDVQFILSSIDQILGALPERAIRLASEGEEASQKLRKLEDQLRKAPREETLKPLLDELLRIKAAITEAEREKMGLTENHNQAMRRQLDLERSDKKLGDNIESQAKHRDAIKWASKVKNVLGTYEQELAVRRVNTLGESVTKCYQVLAHKQSLCKEVSFDPITLQLKLYDVHGNLVYRPLLSKGEKQILSVAILWGLGLCSGRELPVIIDTPLARLDVDHRQALFEEYFPYASHQVVLLSTDSELGESDLHTLEQWTSEVSHLQFDVQTGSTTIEPGYLKVEV